MELVNFTHLLNIILFCTVLPLFKKPISDKLPRLTDDVKVLCKVISFFNAAMDRLCGLVVRVPGYRSGGPDSIPGTTKKKTVVGLEQGPLSLVITTEELLDRKVAAPV
jgi:hypothetical protein